MSWFSAGEHASAAEPVLRLWSDLALGAPWFLGFAPIAWIAMAFALRGHRSVSAGGLPAVGLPRSLRQRLAFVPATLRALAIALFAVALARPIQTDLETADTSEGVDILLVVDRSSSMQAKDMEGEMGSGRTRFEVVREVALDFAQRRMTDRGYARDNVGLLAFAGFPELICPFTLDFDALAGFAEELAVVDQAAEDGTRIGAALAKAVQLFTESDATSRVVVLLSDGEENPGPVIDPLEAADFAARAGVKVHTILAGQRKIEHRLYSPDLFLSQEELDDTQMRAIANRAGGQFFRARDREQLEQIYAEIERLERTPRRDIRLLEAYDLYPPFLLFALVTYGLGWAAATTWWRRTLP